MNITSIALILFAAIPGTALGSITDGVFWELRAAGSNSNSGGFLPGASGVDYSQQTSPQYALTGLTTVAANAIILTASASADMVGNTINVTAGTNFTTGFYIINSVAVGVSITVDRNVTTAAGAAGTANIGGAVQSLQTLLSVIAAQAIDFSVIWVQGTGAQTYLTTTTMTIAWGSAQKSLTIEGYCAVRSDAQGWNVTTCRPLITTATNSIQLFNMTSSNTQQIRLVNLDFSNTATTRAQFWNNAVTVAGMYFFKCRWSGFSNFYNTVGTISNWFMALCEVRNGTISGINSSNNGGQYQIIDSYIHDNVNQGIDMSTKTQGIIMFNSVIANNGQNGLVMSLGASSIVTLQNNVFYNNSASGVSSLGLATNVLAPAFLGNIIYGNGASSVGFISTSTISNFASLWMGGGNAYGNNPGGNRINVPTLTGDVTLTANPFTNPGSNDFSLNNTAGGGAALRGTSFPGPTNFGTGFMDSGALQTQTTLSGGSFGFIN